MNILWSSLAISWYLLSFFCLFFLSPLLSEVRKSTWDTVMIAVSSANHLTLWLAHMKFIVTNISVMSLWSPAPISLALHWVCLPSGGANYSKEGGKREHIGGWRFQVWVQYVSRSFKSHLSSFSQHDYVHIINVVLNTVSNNNMTDCHIV